MLTSKDIKDWFKTEFTEFNECIVGKLYKTEREKLISFRRGAIQSQQVAIGGMENTSYSRIRANCIVHWNTHTSESDAKVLEIEEHLNTLKHPVIAGHEVIKIIVHRNIDIGYDEHDISEYAFEFEIIYKR